MNNQNQQEDEKPKGRWVQCPDMPDECPLCGQEVK